MAADDQAHDRSSHASALAPYVDLLEAYQRAELHTEEFESAFYKLYKYDNTAWDEPELDTLERLFFVLEDFLLDDKLRAEVGGNDVEAVRSQVSRTLLELRALRSSHN